METDEASSSNALPICEFLYKWEKPAKEARNTFPPLPFSHDSSLSPPPVAELPLPSQTININASDTCVGVTGAPLLKQAVICIVWRLKICHHLVIGTNRLTEQMRL